MDNKHEKTEAFHQTMAEEMFVPRTYTDGQQHISWVRPRKRQGLLANRILNPGSCPRLLSCHAFSAQMMQSFVTWEVDEGKITDDFK